MKSTKYSLVPTGLLVLAALVTPLSSPFECHAQERDVRSSSGRAVPVRLSEVAEGYGLTRGGEPYPIHGVGGKSHLPLLASIGGNSIRTWGAENLQPLLDECQELGLTVTVGIWLGHERHGFDYNNAGQVAEQYEKARQAILQYKDHPAVLMWGIGNEMEGYEKGDNAAIWSAINNIASLAKKLDPHHPTMTVVAEIGGDRVKNIHRLCPDIDIVGINSYGGVASLPKRYREAGGRKPYIITEFGPPGTWEVPKNSWQVAAEPTSTAKAEFYRRGYQKGVVGSGGLCLGSYAFVWGHKQEATATWFGMLLPDGSRLAAVDAMQEVWTGSPPKNRVPRIHELKLSDKPKTKPGDVVRATLKADDPEGDPLEVQWVLQAEPLAYGVGGDAEQTPPTFPRAILKADKESAEVRMPKGGGGYRLFAYVRDDHHGAAVANVPLFVDAPVIVPPASQAKLPLVLYDEAKTAPVPFVPSGWMGDAKSLTLSTTCTTDPHGGDTCMEVEYKTDGGWAGVVWQSPANDWGDVPGGWNLTGAKRLTFWARGEKGDEVVTFEYGLLGDDKKFHDSSRGKLDKVRLTNEWKQYSVELQGQDLSRIKTGFAFVVAGQGHPIRFYLDDVRYEP